MCLIVFAWKVQKNFPLILVANRDEFYDRPTAPAAFWDDAPGLLAGRDLQEGGTWLGITRRGKREGASDLCRTVIQRGRRSIDDVPLRFPDRQNRGALTYGES